MPTILLETHINAPIERCFDISRDIDVHKHSMSQSKEEAIAGTTKGLIEEGQWVTWRATHFLFSVKMTVRINEMHKPWYFIDEMTDGPFKKLWHKHSFESHGSVTHMYDEFTYEAPLGFLGKIAEWLFLNKYMTKLLQKRNIVIKGITEKGS